MNQNKKNEELEPYLSTDPNIGLLNEEVLLRQKIFGLNTITKHKSKNFFKIFVSKMFEIMSILLLVSAILALSITIYEHTNNSLDSYHLTLSYLESFVILFIVFLNASISTFHEKKSNVAINSLLSISLPKSKVIRGSQTILIDSSDITIGDIIVVEAGDVICSDAKLISSSNLKCIESILTGESIPVLKSENIIPKENCSIGDKLNYIFSGCNVINGRGVAIVTSIGDKTEIGKIALMLGEEDNIKTPLQIKLGRIGKILGYFGIFFTIFSFIFSLLIVNDVFEKGFNAFRPSLIFSISLACAVIPEGLMTVINIILAFGVKKMSSKKALIKKLEAIETLGSTSIICSDKTGTLTLNKMTVSKLWTPSDTQENVNYNEKISDSKFNLIRYATLCTDCVIEIDENNKKNYIGDPTELSIVELSEKFGFSDKQWDNEYPRCDSIPFDSNRKLMTTINKIHGKYYAITKGAPDCLFVKCKNYEKLTDAIQINESWSKQAVRVLAVAYKEINYSDGDVLNDNEIENDLNFCGLIGMTDPIRPEVKIAINECIRAGIKPVMITGDHLNIASEIGKELGIIREGNLAISGSELDKMSEEEFMKNIQMYSVYARVSPENKIRIVKGWQKLDQVVAMTGDGVNDAPALKAADVGLAMGITGSDVSKSASDVVLIDDNFSTIVDSVKEGRSIYKNIKKIIFYLLTANIASLTILFFGLVCFYFIFSPSYLGWGTIQDSDLWFIQDVILRGKIINFLNYDVLGFTTVLTTMQILLNNVIIETIPAVSLGIQSTSDNLMNVRPRSKFEGIFANKLVWKLIVDGLIQGFTCIFVFVLAVWIAIENNLLGLKFYYGEIAAFIVLSFTCILKAISLSSNGIFYKASFKDTKFLYMCCGIGLLLLIISSSIPYVSGVFGEISVIDDSVFKKQFNLSTEYIDKIKLAIYGQASNFVAILPSYEIYLLSYFISVAYFLYLEIAKLWKNRLIMNNEINLITSFELVKRPKTFLDRHRKIFDIINFRKNKLDCKEK